jgi:putative oxidoreductase
MKVVLWILQIVLAVAFLAAGAMKLTQPLAELAVSLPWTADVPGALVRFIGVAEVLGGLGLVLPAATRILPRLTPIAAAALAIDMVLATLFHLVRGEAMMAPITLLLVALLAFVAWGRTTRAPIAPRAIATTA